MDPPIKKKRGRKPKVTSKEDEQLQTKKIPKKRGRRRKAETEALRKYTDNYEPDKELKFNEDIKESVADKEDIDIEVVNLGGLVITKKKDKTENIKKYQEQLMNTKKNPEKEKVKKKEKKIQRNEFKIIHTNTDNWPLSSDICCWWCSHTFDTPPLFLPIKYDSKTKRFQVKGNFCSWACVKAYNLYSNQPGMFARCTLISLLAKKLHGFSDKPIKCALARESLNIYGGKYSIKQFREYSEDNSRKVIIYNPKIIHVNDNIID